MKENLPPEEITQVEPLPFEQRDRWVEVDGQSAAEGLLSKPNFVTLFDEGLAEWYLSKLAGLDDEEARLKAQFAKKLGAIQSKRKGLQWRYQTGLVAYAKSFCESTGKRTIDLWNGTMRFTKVGQRAIVTDEERLVQHLIAEKRFDLLKSEPRKKDAASYASDYVIKNGGELPPGMDLQEEYDSFSIKFSKETEASG